MTRSEVTLFEGGSALSTFRQEALVSKLRGCLPGGDIERVEALHVYPVLIDPSNW